MAWATDAMVAILAISIGAAVVASRRTDPASLASMEASEPR